VSKDIKIQVGKNTKTVLTYTSWACKKTFWLTVYTITALTGLTLLILPLLLGLATIPANAPAIQQLIQLGIYVAIWYYTFRPLGMMCLNTIKH